MKRSVLLIVVAFLSGFAIRPWILNPDSSRAHWSKVREFQSFLDNPKIDNDLVPGYSVISGWRDPIPSLAALASRGEIRHMNIVLPNVPADSRHTRYWMEFCNSTPGIIWATGNPTYDLLGWTFLATSHFFSISGLKSLHYRMSRS
jgi:hypothetical protein